MIRNNGVKIRVSALESSEDFWGRSRTTQSQVSVAEPGAKKINIRPTNYHYR